MRIISNAGGGSSGTTEAQEAEQNAALGICTAENPAVAGNDPTRDVTIRSATAEDVTGTSSVQGGVVTAVEASGETSQLSGDGTLTGWTYQINPEMFEGLGANTDINATNPVGDRATSIGPWVLGRAYSFPMIVVSHKNNGFFVSTDTPTAHTATADDEPMEGINSAAHWFQIGQLTTAVEVSKLGGIETGADVTDAENVAAAGAVMTSALVVKQSLATLTDAAEITPDLSTSNNFTVTLGGNRALLNPSNPTIGQSGVIFIVQDGTGGRTLTFDTYYKFPGGVDPFLTSTAGATDMLVYMVMSSTFIACQLVPNLG